MSKGKYNYCMLRLQDNINNATFRNKIKNIDLGTRN